jgi:two-component system, cell cycle sensor histidine kinase and response regulator CckA
LGDPEVVVRAIRYGVERKRLTQKLVRLQKLEAVGRLAGNVAHEFNNVLTAIMGNVELADMARDPAVRTRTLQEVRHATTRGALLTRQLLGVSRPHAASAPVADVIRGLTTVKDLLGAVLPRHIQIHVEPIDPLQVAIAPEHLEQVLLNLLLNARGAVAGRGTIFIEAARRMAGADAGTAPGVNSRSWVDIVVRDTGPGIRPDVLPHVFEAFFTTKSQTGSGLGLAISKELIEHAGGCIQARNTPDAGAMFIVELPEVTNPSPPAAVVR